MQTCMDSKFVQQSVSGKKVKLKPIMIDSGSRDSTKRWSWSRYKMMIPVFPMNLYQKLRPFICACVVRLEVPNLRRPAHTGYSAHKIYEIKDYHGANCQWRFVDKEFLRWQSVCQSAGVQIPNGSTFPLSTVIDRLFTNSVLARFCRKGVSELQAQNLRPLIGRKIGTLQSTHRRINKICYERFWIARVVNKKSIYFFLRQFSNSAAHWISAEETSAGLFALHNSSPEHASPTLISTTVCGGGGWTPFPSSIIIIKRPRATRLIRRCGVKKKTRGQLNTVLRM